MGGAWENGAPAVNMAHLSQALARGTRQQFLLLDNQFAVGMSFYDNRIAELEAIIFQPGVPPAEQYAFAAFVWANHPDRFKEPLDDISPEFNWAVSVVRAFEFVGNLLTQAIDLNLPLLVPAVTNSGDPGLLAIVAYVVWDRRADLPTRHEWNELVQQSHDLLAISGFLDE